MFSRVLMNQVGLAATFTSPAVEFDAEKYSLHVIVKNPTTLTATVKAQISNNGTDWVDHPDFTAALTVATGIMWRDWAASYRYVRVVFTRTAGSADVDVIFVAKGGVSNV
jgi:hypothetical protein